MTLLTFRLIFFAGVISLAISPILARAIISLSLVDMPGSEPHKQHSNPVPLAGGWVILLTVLIIGLLNGVLRSAAIWTILIPSLIVFGFGLWDDVRGLSTLVKMTGQLLATLLLIYLDVYVRLFDPSLNWLNWGLTVLWVVGITNAYNFVDSMDGLAIGLAGVAAAFLMLVTFDSQQLDLSIFSTILLGACIGTYFYNATPAHLFLGDSGSQWLGFSLASLAIAYNPVGFLRIQSWFIPILLMGVPIFDTTLVVTSRLRRRLPIYKAHFDHTYHRLVAFGMSANRAVLLMHLSALLLGCLAFITLSTPPLLTNIVYGTCLLIGTIIITFMDSKKRWS